VLRREDQVFQLSKLESDIKEAHSEISRLEGSQKDVRSKKFDKLGEQIKEKSSEISLRIEALSDERLKLNQIKSTATSERLDTLAFLSSVKERLISLEHSTITNQEFGDIGFDYCPSCLSELESADGEHGCKLCKRDHSSGSRKG
jgi:chromosome segregation ATPase